MQVGGESQGPSVGTAYPDNNAVMTVNPGKNLPTDEETEVTISGTGYDPSAPVYVGLGR